VTKLTMFHVEHKRERELLFAFDGICVYRRSSSASSLSPQPKKGEPGPQAEQPRVRPARPGCRRKEAQAVELPIPSR
jgi:hypothetical protein